MSRVGMTSRYPSDMLTATIFKGRVRLNYARPGDLDDRSTFIPVR